MTEEATSAGSTDASSAVVAHREFEDGWVEELHPQLVGAVALYCGDVGAAEEAAQEALIRLWLRRDRIANPRAWAYRVAFNQVTSTFRRRSSERRAMVRLAGRSSAISPSGDDVDEALDLRAALQQLPERQRQAVLLRYLADLDLAEVATVMGCAEGTVKSHLARGLAGLRAVPELDQFIELPMSEEDE